MRKCENLACHGRAGVVRPVVVFVWPDGDETPATFPFGLCRRCAEAMTLGRLEEQLAEGELYRLSCRMEEIERDGGGERSRPTPERLEWRPLSIGS